MWKKTTWLHLNYIINLLIVCHHWNLLIALVAHQKKGKEERRNHQDNNRLDFDIVSSVLYLVLTLSINPSIDSKIQIIIIHDAEGTIIGNNVETTWYDNGRPQSSIRFRWFGYSTKVGQSMRWIKGEKGFTSRDALEDEIVSYLIVQFFSFCTYFFSSPMVHSFII